MLKYDECNVRLLLGTYANILYFNRIAKEAINMMRSCEVKAFDYMTHARTHTHAYTAATAARQMYIYTHTIHSDWTGGMRGA